MVRVPSPPVGPSLHPCVLLVEQLNVDDAGTELGRPEWGWYFQANSASRAGTCSGEKSGKGCERSLSWIYKRGPNRPRCPQKVGAACRFRHRKLAPSKLATSGDSGADLAVPVGRRVFPSRASNRGAISRSMLAVLTLRRASGSISLRTVPINEPLCGSRCVAKWAERKSLSSSLCLIVQPWRTSPHQ